jgi:hypothetical protein
MPLLAIILKHKMGIVSSENKPAAFLRQGCICVLVRLLEVLPLFFVFLLTLHLFTYQCLRHPIFGKLFL